MADLIDRDEILDELINCENVPEAIAVFDFAKRVDAEVVIHCKDCAEYENGRCKDIAYIMDGYYRGAEKREPDDYCSRGVKKA